MVIIELQQLIDWFQSNIMKKFRESREISACKGQNQKLSLNACDLCTLRQHCMKNRHDCMKDITILAREHFRKQFLVKHSLLLHLQMQVKTMKQS